MSETIDLRQRAATLLGRSNLFAWCVASHDGAQRSPEERAAMLARLGIPNLAWGNRMAGVESLPLFAAEAEALERHGLGLLGRFFPAVSTAEECAELFNERLLRLAPQIWIPEGDPCLLAEDQEKRIQQEAARVRPVAAAARRLGLRVALYNHRGWFGHPENQLAIIERLRDEGLPNVGMAFCLHWSHDFLDRFEELFARMQPHLFALMLSGLFPGGDRDGRQFPPLGAGSEDLRILRCVLRSSWAGPVGLINHTSFDAEERLADHLDGLAWLVTQLDGGAGAAPAYRTWPA